MPQLTESDAEKLTPEQATDLVRILDLQARWENHLDDPVKKTSSVSELHIRQKSHDGFQAALREYSSKYRNAEIPVPTQNMPDRLALWCRVLRVVFQRAESGKPAQVLAKLYRLSDRLAVRMGKEPVARTTPEDLAGAVRELDTIIAWCSVMLPTDGVDKLRAARMGEAA